MIESRYELIEWLNCEKKYYDVSGALSQMIKYFAGSEPAVIWHIQRRLRLTEYYYNTSKRIRLLFSKALLNRLKNKYGIHIGLNVCGKGLRIMHLGSILINSNALIGENVALHINTSIVAQGTNKGVPQIGNGVVIGVGAVVLGNIKIADNIAIGANSVVNKSFLEPNIAIAGVPAKKISDNGRLNWNKNSV